MFNKLSFLHGSNRTSRILARLVPRGIIAKTFYVQRPSRETKYFILSLIFFMPHSPFNTSPSNTFPVKTVPVKHLHVNFFPVKHFLGLGFFDFQWSGSCHGGFRCGKHRTTLDGFSLRFSKHSSQGVVILSVGNTCSAFLMMS